MPRLPGNALGRHRRPRRRIGTVLRCGLALVAVTAGALALSSPARPPAPTAVHVTDSPPAPVLLTTPAARQASAPASVSIPAIGVDGPLVQIGVDAAGALVPPADPFRAGWFAAGTTPGEVGPAVLAGHVDDRTGPAVFYRLEDLSPGDRVVITRADGQVLPFTVTRVAAYPKDDFPTAEVYGPTTGAELRLITCGGAFDRSRRSYLDNVVVYARGS